jgi:HipA-like protein
MRKGPLNVFVNTTRAGRLARSDREEDTILFGYGEDCSPENAVSLTMPVRVDQYDAVGGLVPIFEMNLPEGLLRERLRNEFAKAIPEFDDLDLLSIVGSSQIGCLRYSSQPHLEESVPLQDLKEILTYRAAGLETVRARLSENRKLLVLDRFDLRPDGTYLGTEDFCVLEGRRAHGRYDGSYEAIARRICEFVSAGSLAHAREQFALSVAYSCAIENGDAHLKNFSVLYDSPEGEVRFAPTYDLVSTTVYIHRDSLALTLGGTKQFPSRAELIRFIRLVTAKGERGAIEVLERAADGVSASIREAQDYARKHPGARRFVDRLVESMSRGLARLGCTPKRGKSSSR